MRNTLAKKFTGVIVEGDLFRDREVQVAMLRKKEKTTLKGLWKGHSGKSEAQQIVTLH